MRRGIRKPATAADEHGRTSDSGLRWHGANDWEASNGIIDVRELRRKRILSADELRNCRDGEFVRTAGCVIARQRPGTAKGFIFLSMEDETGIANVIVTPDLYERERLVVTQSKFILAEGILQNQDGVIHVKATRLSTLSHGALELRSHDFH